MNLLTVIGLLALVSLSSAGLYLWIKRLYKFLFFEYNLPLVSYNQEWFKGDADADGGHVHEGIQLAARDGFVAVGETLNGNTKKVLIKLQYSHLGIIHAFY